MTSPSDKLAQRTDQFAFACVPRHLVEEYRRILGTHNPTASLTEAFEYTDALNDAAREIAEAARDDIS